jgi:transposase
VPGSTVAALLPTGPPARFTTGANRIDPSYRHVLLARLGRIRTHESTRKLARRVLAGTATVLSATVTETAGRWFCSLQVAVKRTTGRPAHAPKSGRVLGVDAGIKYLADAAPATLRRHLTYKTGWYGSTLYVADRWYPSSKTCSACQTVKPKLSLAERTFNCATCGFSLDRDVNAARNLAA